MAKSLYRRYTVVRRKYSTEHGFDDPVEAVRYKWTDGGEEVIGYAGPVNVMGQEDLFREDSSGQRVDNPGTARIVFSSNTPVRRFQIFYTFDTLQYNRQTPIIDLGNPTHNVEFFLTPVTVSAEYKFKVRIYDPVDDSQFEDSRAYWFTTQGRTGITSTGLVTTFNFGQIEITDEFEQIEQMFEAEVLPDSPKASGTLSAIPTEQVRNGPDLSVSHTNPPITTTVSHVFI